LKVARLKVEGCRLQVAGCRLQVAGCRLQVAGCRLQVAGWKVLIPFSQASNKNSPLFKGGWGGSECVALFQGNWYWFSIVNLQFTTTV
jgi:hypothetical protein